MVADFDWGNAGPMQSVFQPKGVAAARDVVEGVAGVRRLPPARHRRRRFQGARVDVDADAGGARVERVAGVVARRHPLAAQPPHWFAHGECQIRADSSP